MTRARDLDDVETSLQTSSKILRSIDEKINNHKNVYQVTLEVRENENCRAKSVCDQLINLQNICGRETLGHLGYATGVRRPHVFQACHF